MKKNLVIMVLLAFNANSFAASKVSCNARVLAKASKIKTEVKSIIRGVDDQMDYQLDKYADPTIGMGERGQVAGAQSILDAVRELQEDTKMQTPDVLKQLCDNNMNVEKTISE